MNLISKLGGKVVKSQCCVRPSPLTLSMNSMRMFSAPVYIPKKKLEFKNGSLKMYQCGPFTKKFYNTWTLCSGISAGLTFMTLRSMYKLRPFRTILWGIPSIFMFRGLRMVTKLNQIFVNEIYLLQNCQQVVVSTLFGSKYTFMIKNIKRVGKHGVDPSIIGLYASIKSRYNRDYIPIQVDNVPLLIEREMNLEKNLKNKGEVLIDMEVFLAILNGMEIDNDPSKLDEVIIEEQESDGDDKKKNDENIIDI
ncbi:unnamed protein product [Moneuplotes crassus]|uniref:Uncharacterized protein n=1 Tax=Euplotes crassus TaxID=5936 RepID=A0AAD1XT78_EUPCR|nr:unnamed protein product [Moneuplotes crassus]